MKYFLYARKSTEEEEKQALSLSTQIEKAHEIFPDLDLIELPPESASAFTPNNRPIFEDMLKRIDAGEANGGRGVGVTSMERATTEGAALCSVTMGSQQSISACMGSVLPAITGCMSAPNDTPTIMATTNMRIAHEHFMRPA